MKITLTLDLPPTADEADAGRVVREVLDTLEVEAPRRTRCPYRIDADPVENLLISAFRSPLITGARE